MGFLRIYICLKETSERHSLKGVLITLRKSQNMGFQKAFLAPKRGMNVETKGLSSDLRKRELVFFGLISELGVLNDFPVFPRGLRT